MSRPYEIKVHPGDVYDRLTVRVQVSFGNSRARRWECQCICGVVKEIPERGLVRGTSRSCGCLNMESRRAIGAANRTHGKEPRAEYTVWKSMKTRCLNPRNASFKAYGARGISVCDRWLDFPVFLSDMGLRPTPFHSLERVNNNLGYSPDNCVWATRDIQANNKRNNVVLEFGGERKTVAQWSRTIGVLDKTIYCRVKSGLPIENVLSRADRRVTLGSRTGLQLK